MNVSAPYEEQPMWHRRGRMVLLTDNPSTLNLTMTRIGGGMVLLTDKPGLRVEEQDWSSLTIDAFPTFTSTSTIRKSLFTIRHAKRTDLSLTTNGAGGEASPLV